jgi:phage terminase large subunit
MSDTVTAELKVNKAYDFLGHYGPRYEVISGGAGSGKSYAVAQYYVLGALTSKTRRYLCVRKIAKTLRQSVFATLSRIISDMGLTSFFEINKSEMTFTCVTGSRFILVGLDDPEKIKSIEGITDVWLEEATEFLEEDLNQLNLRMRGGLEAKRIILTFNPIINTHWLKRRFFDSPDPDVHTYKTTYRDNAFLDAAYVNELENLRARDENFWKVYAEGEWGEQGDAVFTRYMIHDFDYADEQLENVAHGIDFGFNHASAVERCGMKDGELYVFDEFYRKGITNRELIDHVKEFDPSFLQHRYIADSAEPARILEFQKADFQMFPAVKGPASLRDGIDYLRSLMIHVHRSKCPNLAREISSYQYRVDKKTGERVDEFVEFNDDCIAALRYATEAHRALYADWGVLR